MRCVITRRLFATALLLLFLATAPTPVLAQGGVWVEKSAMPTPGYGGLGEAIVGTGTYIYAIRCASTGACQFRRYDPAGNSWTQLTSWTPGNDPPPDNPPPRTKSGTAFAWDRGDYIYCLLGAAGSDTNRLYFYRYTISSGTWQRMADTPHAQGAGDALTWSGYDNSVYATLGSNDPGRGSGFARYHPSTNSWESLSLRWTITDDGASLAWTGGEYLYVLRGEWHETTPNNEFARYRISTGTWDDMAPIPVPNGVGDGGSMLWIGNWVDPYSDYIFALGGNDVLENPGNGFYAYSISRNQWTSLETLPYPVGYNAGNRLGFAAGHIYYWQGAPSAWAGGGYRFCMFSGYKLMTTVYPSSVTVGSWTTRYTVQRQDENGNPVTSGSTTINLASTSTGVNKKFAETPGGATVTSVTVPDGSSTKDFYYYDEKAGSWTIYVSATGIAGDSKPLTVNPGILASFTMSGYPSSTTAGENFDGNNIIVTAYDAYGNVKSDYIDQVYFTSTDSQAVLPYTSSSKYRFTTGTGQDNGVHMFAGSGFNLRTVGSQTITLTDGTKSTPSSPITVITGALDHIDVTPSSATITAGQSVTYTAQAFDLYGNSLGDVTASTSWSITLGAGGSWSTNVYTSEKSGTWTVTGTYSGKSNTPTLNVNPAALDHFVIAAISSPQIAGTSFSITITAADVYGNTVTGYAGTNTLSDSTGTIAPISTGAFTAGVWTGSVTVTKAQTGVTIHANDGSGHVGTSDSFDVDAAAQDHFTFATIGSSQTAGAGFAVTITAKDAFENTVTSYTGTNTLVDTTDTISPVSTTAFSSGVWSGSVTITVAQSGVTITTSGGGKSGTSNPFSVVPASGNRLVMTVYPSSVVAGSWTTAYTVQRQDQYGNPVSSGSATVNLASTSDGVNKKFSASSGGSSVTSVTIADGASTTNFYYYEEKAGSWAISVSATVLIGDSESLVVSPSTLGQFAFGTVGSPQTVGVGFSVTITAVDQYGNTVTSYAASNMLSDSTGTITPTSTGFSSGVWSGSVTITKAQTGVAITTSGGGKSGTSNSFTVNHGQPSFLVYVSGDGLTGKCNQECPQSLKVRVVDEFQNPVADDAVTWEITSYPTGATGQRLSNIITVTDQNGESLVRFRFGSMPGIYRIRAIGLTQYTFTLTAVGDPPPTPRPVGGLVMPINKFEIVEPYVALAGLVVAISAVAAVKRRRD